MVNNDDDDDSPSPPAKRHRNNDGDVSSSLVEYNDNNNNNTGSSSHANNIRTSSLPSPTMQLSGHKGSVYAIQYSPDGSACCSGGFDMKALLWSHSDYTNYNLLDGGHKNAILDLQWDCFGTNVYTASADKTIANWDANTGQRIRKLVGHDNIVNAIDTSASTTTTKPSSAEGDELGNNASGSASNHHLIVSASDDCTAKLWDCRTKYEVASLPHEYQVTAVALGGGIGNTNYNVFTGGIDNLIVAWDIRKSHQKIFAMKGHSDTITCLSIHPNGTHLLSNSMDHSIKSWDIRPFVVNKANRHCKTFVGATHNAEKGLLKCSWSPAAARDGKDSSSSMMITAGSADRMVHIWDEFSTEELYLLPGHKGCINTVVFHPTENIIASGSSDKTIYVGELGQ